MFLLSFSDPAKAMNDFANRFVIWLFELFICIPLLLVCLIVSGAKFGRAVSNYILVKGYTMDDDRYKLTKAEPVSVEEGFYSELTYTAGYVTCIIKATGAAETPVYVLYKVSSPEKGIVYSKEYQRDEIVTRAVIMLASAALFAVCLYHVLF